MLQTLDTHCEFEALARGFLAEHPEIRHEWRPVPNFFYGGRTDLVCYPGELHEVFASLTKSQITIGSGAGETDFEDFGRGLNPAELAAEAFSRFTYLLSGSKA
jgi:hypothetical protein